MRFLRVLQLAVVALAVGVGGTVVVASPAANAASTSSPAARTEVRTMAPSFESEVLRLTNAARQRNGLRALKPMRCVDSRASRWSRRMAARDMFRHQPMRNVARACKTRFVGENIAMGSNLTPAQVVRLWMRSPGHRKNILLRGYGHLGVGAYRSADTGRIYVTQNFRR